MFYFFIGCLISEGFGAVWHRFVTHLGYLKILDKYARGRHFDHHIFKYPMKRLFSAFYHRSCELTFHLMGVVIIACLVLFVYFQILTIANAILVLFGALVYGVFVLGHLHDLYHVEESVVKQTWVGRYDFIWRKYLWFRDYHIIHHYRNKNFSILIPLFDWIMGSFMSPSKLPEILRSKRKAENLFPGFVVSDRTSC